MNEEPLIFETSNISSNIPHVYPGVLSNDGGILRNVYSNYFQNDTENKHAQACLYPRGTTNFLEDVK